MNTPCVLSLLMSCNRFNFLFAKVSSIQISLTYGYIVVKVTATNGRSRTLTSSSVYGDGTNHVLVLSLSRSLRTLILTTDKEKTTKGLQFIPSEDVMNFTEIFVGGVPSLISEELDLANISGCVGLSTVAELNPIPFPCTTGNDVMDCSLCSDKVSATFI